ncbi:E-selectin [Entelurus aequoreus]|uniref:E-selectin n=1 Tax=Entelurus aequoreus TaxID=161455 RepID=UPI002B1DFDCE|nr:E-selectin [Entelurus aequoreus]
MEKVLLAILAASGKSQGHVTGASLTVMLAGVCAVSSAAQRRFYFVYEPKSWKEARLHCRARHQNLASVDGEEHVKAIMACVDPCQMPAGDQHAWIEHHSDRLDWTWSGSGRRLHKSRDFQRWAPGEPNNIRSSEDCVEMYNNGRWNDCKCGSRLPAVCVGRRDVELKSSHLVRVSVVWKNSSVDLSDAAVKEGILKQLEQRLQQSAPKQNVTLSWDRQWDGKVFHEKTNRTIN